MLMYLVVAAVFLCVTCLVGGMTLMFRGGDGSLVEDRLDFLTGAGAAKGGGKADSANVLVTPLDEVPGLTELLFSKFIDLRTYLQQAGTTLTPAKFGVLSLLFAGLGMAGCVLGRLPLYAAPAGALAGLLPLLWIWFQRRTRLSRFAKQLPEALELIARALRAGHSLGSGFKLVADEMAAPISLEFERCYEAQNLGQPLEEAIEEMTERVPNLDLRFFATAVILQRQTGGDLAEILDKIGHLVRERFKIWGQIQALTGEGRLSGIVLLALPPVLFVVMWRLNPQYSMTLFTDPMGQQMLAGAIVMQVIGAIVIQKIISIKV